MSELSLTKDRYWLHILLLFLTLLSTIWAGAQLVDRDLLYEVSPVLFAYGNLVISTTAVWDGFLFGGSLLLFLTVHEFGHYFAARYHGVSTSLPYYIPFPFNGIGTFGAVIRIRQQVPSLRKLFDIGVAGPVAGFVVALIVLIVGFATMPGPDYMEGMAGHENLKEYIAQNGAFPDEPLLEDSEEGMVSLIVGMTPLFWILSSFFSDVPPMWEMYHYPVLFAGWLGLFFTALNLLPVGQLDGGHILYALVGPKWHSLIARGFILVLLFSGGIGFADEMKPIFYEWDPLLGDFSWLLLSVILYFFLNRIFDRMMVWIAPTLIILISGIAAASRIDWVTANLGYSGWFVWCLLIIFLIRVDHPPVVYMEPLTRKRKMLAVASIIIFALCFSIKPLYIG